MDIRDFMRRAWRYFRTRLSLDSPFAWLRAYEFHLRLRSTDPQSKMLFSELFTLIGKLIFSDGRVGPDELRGIKDVFRAKLGLPDSLSSQAIKTLNLSKHDARAAEEVARSLNSLLGEAKQVKLLIADILLGVAFANGQISKKEQYVLAIAFRTLGLKETDTESIQAAYAWRVKWDFVDEESAEGGRQSHGSRRRHGFDETQELLDDCYAVLGSKPSDDNQSIKLRYRKLVMQLHPDRVVQTGATPEFVKQAEERFRAVQEAYEEIERQRGNL